MCRVLPWHRLRVRPGRCCQGPRTARGALTAAASLPGSARAPRDASERQACLAGRIGRKLSLKSLRVGCTSPSVSAAAGLGGVLKTQFLLADRQRGSLPMAVPKMSRTRQREERVRLARSPAAAARRYKWQPRGRVEEAKFLGLMICMWWWSLCPSLHPVFL